MKICIMIDRIPPEGRGGAERVAWQTARAFVDKGNEVAIITATSEGSEPVVTKTIDGVRVHYVYSAYAERWRAWRSLYNPGPVRAVKDILKEYRPDVVHIHNVHYHLSYHVVRVAKQSGARVFVTAHDVMLFTYGKLYEFIDPKNPVCKTEWNYHVSAWQKLKRFKWRYSPWRNVVIRWYVRQVDTFFSVSNALRQALLQNNMPDSTVLHNAIDLTEWSVETSAVDAFTQKFALLGRKVLFFGGRLNAAKGGRQLLEALRVVAQKDTSVVLLVASVRDSYLEQLMAQAKEWGIEDNIISTGYLEGGELRAAYHASDVVVVPSVCFDSFPTMVLEAMACKKPVVATCFGGSSESVLDGETGYLVNPYDTGTFAQTLLDLLSSSEKATLFGVAGYARAKELFSLDRHIALLEGYYTK